VRVASLGSGSRGNATLVAQGPCLVMVDCGFSPAQARQRAARLGVDLNDLDAILVTHEHSDHASGVAALSRRLRVPVYASYGSFASGRLDGCYEQRPFNADSRLRIGSLDVHAVPVPHDAREPVQFVFEGDGRCGLLTDLGSVTPHVIAAYRGCDALLLEFNHDRRMLEDGPYPPALKRRVGGPWGHLSNTQAIELLEALATERPRRVYVAHVSDKNNHPQRIEALVAERLPDLLPCLHWACQEQGFSWYEVDETRAVPLAPAEPGGAY
jgi:phosphoribosyl 1,2-cyclic phosphodiesterase